jgi:hypothetical protein
MPGIRQKPIRYLIVLLLVAAALGFAGARLRRQQSWPKAKPFTLVSATYQVAGDGTRVLESTTTKFVRNSASWRQIMVLAKTEKVQQSVAKDGGIYDIVGGKLEWASPAVLEEEPEVPPTEYFKGFVRTERLFGLTAYVARSDFGPGEWGETWYTQETLGTPLKMYVNLKSGKFQRVTEPMSLTFGDIPDNIFDGLDLPVSFDRAGVLLKAAERAGHQEYVDQTKAQMETEKKRRNQ